MAELSEFEYVCREADKRRDLELHVGAPLSEFSRVKKLLEIGSQIKPENRKQQWMGVLFAGGLTAAAVIAFSAGNYIGTHNTAEINSSKEQPSLTMKPQ